MPLEPINLNLAEELIEQLEVETVFTIPGTNISVDEATAVSWIIMAVILIAAFFLTRNLKVEGEISRRQAFLESCVDTMESFFINITGVQGRRYLPWLMSTAVFIGVSNMIGFIGFKPPTKSLSATAGMAILSIIMVQIAGIRQRGTKGWLKSFAKPMPIILPINILELFIKPLSLCMRLFGNVLGAFIIMEIVKNVVFTKIGVSLALSCYFDLFDGFLQAYIFVFLTALYIQEAVESGEA